MYVSVCVSVCVCVYCIFSTHSFVGGYLVCFSILPVVNNTAVNIGVSISFQISVSYSLDKYPVELLDPRVIFFCNVLRNLHSLPQWLHLFAFPPAVQEDSFFSTSSATLVFSCVFNLPILTGVRCYHIVVLIFISLVMSDVEHPFCVYWPSECLLWRKKCLFMSSAYF